jgi:quercetin dioxygenase-like cupin family protein
MIRIDSSKVQPIPIPPLFGKALPEQGSVELQRDAPGKEHAWHEHPVDETIIILEGGLVFYWEEGRQICQPGDVIHLPAGSRHGSIALGAGATYLIAMRQMTL